MQDIPKPALLDPDRVDRDDRDDLTTEDRRTQSQLLAKALVESCGYAEQLWEQLDGLRRYLVESLPPDPRTPGAHHRTGTSPVGLDDEDGWQRWIAAYGAATSTLSGAHGDSGWGVSEARDEAKIRRESPELRVHERHPELTSPAPPAAAAAEAPATGRSSRSVLRTAATAALAVLALRGLRPRGGPRIPY